MDPYDPKRNSSFPNLKKDTDTDSDPAQDNEFRDPLVSEPVREDYASPTAPPHYTDYNQYNVNDPYALPPGQKWPHSKLGVASFVIGLSTIVINIILVVIAVIMVASAVGSTGTSLEMLDEENITAWMSGMLGGLVVLILIWGFMIFANFTGLVLGIVGCCIKQRRKIFAILGVVLNALPAAFLLLSLLLGIFSEGNY
ncbi:hypothetical protein [Paenibacillus kyungheensis]